jgi:hypothetical protein
LTILAPEARCPKSFVRKDFAAQPVWVGELRRFSHEFRPKSHLLSPLNSKILHMAENQPNKLKDLEGNGMGGRGNSHANFLQHSAKNGNGSTQVGLVIRKQLFLPSA